MIDIGIKLKNLRLNKNLTQQQVANIIGISKAMVSSYELNTREPSLTVLTKMCSLYSISLDSLVGLERGEYIDIKGLSPKQVTIVQSIIDSYRELK